MENKKEPSLDEILSALNSGMKKDETGSAGEQKPVQEAPARPTAPADEKAPDVFPEPSQPETPVNGAAKGGKKKRKPVRKAGASVDSASKAAQKEKREAFDQDKEKKESEPPRLPRRKRKRMSRREKTTAVLGIFVTFFVVIGVISTIWFGVNLTKELVNSTAEKEKLARVIFPLVIVDIPEFDSPASLDNSAIIQSAIWAFIVDEKDKSQYPKDDLGAMTVPDTDIELYIRKLYGSTVKIQHQSIDDASVQMLYDSENKKYIIESTPRFLPYTPRVDKIQKDGDIYTLRVSYVLPDALWNLKKDHSDATVDKVMEYRLKETNGSYQMLAVKLLEVTERTGQNLSANENSHLPEDDVYSDTGSVPAKDAAPQSDAAGEAGAAGTSSAADTSSAA